MDNVLIIKRVGTESNPFIILLLEATSFQGTLISSNRSSLGVGNDALEVLRYQTALALLAV